MSTDSTAAVSNSSHYPHPIDIVYTWVNGSDLALLADLSYHKANLYLDRNIDAGRDVTRLHCPFELCGFNDHFLISPLSSDMDSVKEAHLMASLSEALRQALSAANVTLHFIGRVNQSTYSRKSGILFQSSVSMSNLFVNQSEFRLTVPQFADDAFSISQIFVAATDAIMGHPVTDHVFLSGFPEMRDASTENNWRTIISAQLPNNTKLVKASATSFLIALSPTMDVDKFNETFNVSSLSTEVHLSRAVLIVDLGLVTVISDLSESRFQDNDELKYSLRSLTTFVHFFRHVFIVTNGQVPSWLNTDHPSITIVPHSQIFSNKSHLPTFNSAAIEAHLHNIPGLAPHFIYLNDDVFFGKTVYPEDFYSPSTGYKVYLGWSVPNCVEACPSSWLADGFCDHDCNVAECQWDSGDCVKTGGNPGMINSVPNLNSSLLQNENFQSMLAGMTSGFCSLGCNTNWLADRYCDQACNVENCGFDLGDCGDSNIARLPSARLTQIQGQLVFVANGTRALVIYLADVIGVKDQVTQAMIDDSREVLASSYAVKYRMVVIAFNHPNSCKDCYFKRDQRININLTVSHGSNSTLNIHTALVLNPHALHLNVTTGPTLATAQPPTTSSYRNETVKAPIIEYDNSSEVLSLPVHGNDKNLSVELLEWERPLEMSRYRLLLQDGLISVSGYRHLLHELWLSRANHNQSDMRLSAIENELIIERLPWGFLPWENVGKSSDMALTLSDSSNTDSMRHLLDLYAESLRYSNRILSRAYYASQRRVPAHGPHFISTDIFAEAKKKFLQPWTQTATHRFRSPNDVQFAFTYFYFLMAENLTTSVTDLLHSVDTDHSGSLNTNEIRTLLLRMHHNATLSLSFLDETIVDIRNSCARSTEPLSSFNIDIPELAYCFNWTGWQQPRPVSRYRFTSHEDTDLAFIMISAVRDKVVKDLDGLRRTPKKFFCLNDNLPNTKQVELVSLIRGDVKEFLDFMFPVASPFEWDKRTERRVQSYMRLSTVVAVVLSLLLLGVVIKKLSQVVRNGHWSCRLSLSRPMRILGNIEAVVINL